MCKPCARPQRHGDAAATAALYGGELLPGHFDEWVLEERRLLDEATARLCARPGAGTTRRCHCLGAEFSVVSDQRTLARRRSEEAWRDDQRQRSRGTP